MSEAAANQEYGTDLLPSSIPREIKNEVFSKGLWWVQGFCANCCCEGPYFVKEALMAPGGFAFWLCSKCEKHGIPAGMMRIPDEVIWEKGLQEQLAQRGRPFTANEMIEALKDDKSVFCKLAKDRTRR